MVTGINKWLLIAISASLSFGTEGFGVPGSGFRGNTGRVPHPFHVSVIEIEHNAGEKTLEISCKIFTDDFEKVLAQNYKTKVDLINPPNINAMDSLVKKYLFSHLTIKVNGRPVPFTYIGYENDKEAAYGYIEGANVASLSNVEVSTNIMYDLFDDQMNIIHVKAGGGRKSTKLNYPEANATISF